MELLGTSTGSVDGTDNPEVQPGDINANPNPNPDTTPPDWFAALPEEMQADPGIGKFKGKTVVDVLTSYKHLESKVGEKGILPLKEDATDEEKVAYYTALGRPEKAEGYELVYPEGFPENLKNEELATNFRTFAYEQGLTKVQAENLMKWNLELAQTQHDGFTTIAESARVAATDALKTEWGANFIEKLGKAEAELNHFDPDFRDFLVQSGLNNDPRMIRHLYRLATERREDSKLVDGGLPGGGGSFEARRDALMKHPAFGDATHKEHLKVHSDLKALYAEQYPEKKE